MNAFEELQTLGDFGELSVNLLIQITRQEAQRVPVLKPVSGWEPDDIRGLVHDFYLSDGARVVAAMLLTVTDIDSMGRYLRISIRNHLITLARSKPLGRIRRKVTEILNANPSIFTQIPAGVEGATWWHLSQGVSTPFNGDFRPLVAAAKSVQGINIVRWEGHRRSPLATDADLITIIEAVLSQAQGSVDVQTLTLVIAERFTFALESEDLLIDQENWEKFSGEAEDQPGFDLEISEAAKCVYSQLSPAQRSLLPHLAKSLKDQGQILGLGKSQTASVARKLKNTLQELVPESDEREPTTLEIYRLCVINP